ncbi:sodium:solute symporter [Hymenobacter weizhouensis]|uniref:sodium:solute symporter n=1 Tax=Hymenobacter sp. YIM 151500-1 TaxID=2987689 RepID=UPI002225D967|nr:sodium:solute symporter [Hymenobacter sp. YIM 151500-1]UYZ65055.1 sodium:solute symporter [Hymenobacter sp. YIM 151500-1]
MSPTLVLSLIAGYFVVLIIIALLTSRKATSESFFVANRNAPWYMVAFAMIGTSLSGVTFVSVPGQVLTGQWSYLALVFGYVAGYAVIGTVLLPLYYRLNLVSIYTYLEQRFGFWSYKTGAAFFLLSRAIGAAFRLFLVAGVLQLLVFEKMGVPFAVTVTVSILLIYLYTFRGGLKTILWTDTFQTLAMLLCVVVSIGLIGRELNLGWAGLVQTVRDSPLSETFFFDDPNSKKYFWKQFAAGMFITITMTGLDQDLMQKNLSCRSLRDAQKNMFWFTLTLVFVNILFLSLGVLLYKYADVKGLALDQLPELLNLKGKLDTDKVFPYLATSHFSLFAGVVFVLGIIAVTYASADSALTALTTSFCVDFLGISRYPEAQQKSMRQLTHLAFTAVLIVIILIFRALNDQNVVSAVFDAAGYTYGPLLGLYAFGLYTQRRPEDRWVPIVCVLSPVLTWVLVRNAGVWFNGYEIGFEKLIYNGLLTFLGLWAVSQRVPKPELNPVA